MSLQSPPLPIPSLFNSRSTPPSFPKTLPAGFLTLRRHFRRRFTPILAVPLAGDELVPAVRSYESDLACLTLVGAVSVEQVLTAAAADGGSAAEEHLASGAANMVVEALFPGRFDDHSTVSTRLFLPAEKVKAKAKKLRSSLSPDIFSSNPSISKNILAMTFRQVVLRHIWSFKLSLFCPGIERNMNDLSSSRKAPTEFTMNSSNHRFISSLAEVVCSCALENVRDKYVQNTGGSPSDSLFNWYQKPKVFSSFDSSVSLYRLSHRDVVKLARNQVKKFSSKKLKAMTRGRKIKNLWWVPPDHPELDKAEGPEFSAWTNEFVPAYRLQINADTFKDANLEGWNRFPDNRWEALLSHLQMVELANILDMYYEDQYTVPEKQLSCALITETLRISNNKWSSWKSLSVAVAGGCVLILFGVLAQLGGVHLLRPQKTLVQNNFTSISETDCCHIQSPENTEVESLCLSIVKKIKDELCWTGDIVSDKSIGSWTGMLPIYLRNNGAILDNLSCDRESQNYNEISTQDIVSYQVVFSGDGKIIGFQPTSRAAVNHWASNPLATVLYEGRKLSPGLLEPRLKIPRPRDTVLIELLMSVKPESHFALARPMR